MRFLSLTVLVVCLGVFTACSKPPSASGEAAAINTPATRLQQIAPADPQKYNAIRDMKTWHNPYLIVSKDGISLLDVKDSEERPVKPDQLLDTLAALPASAWPYGRVVAVEEGGASSDDERVALRKNRAVLAGTLESAKVSINWVPAS